MSTGTHETEIKLAVAGAAGARRLLRAAGFRVSCGRVFESNLVFDSEDLRLRRSSRLLRVRTAGRRVTVTFKGPPLPARHKVREEFETEAGDAGTLRSIFQELGYHPVFRYEKYRTEFRPARGRGIAVLDETPIGVYLELEGAAGWIDRTARKLGFSESEYITASYGRLYLGWCREQGRTPGDMVFD
jgi:adenylate cyclase class 2